MEEIEEKEIHNHQASRTKKNHPRRRVLIACEHCRKRKIKCDGKNPCSNCSKRSKPCTYITRKKRGPKPLASLSKALSRTKAEADGWKVRYFQLLRQSVLEQFNTVPPPTRSYNNQHVMEGVIAAFYSHLDILFPWDALGPHEPEYYPFWQHVISTTPLRLLSTPFLDQCRLFSSCVLFCFGGLLAGCVDVVSEMEKKAEMLADSISSVILTTQHDCGPMSERVSVFFILYHLFLTMRGKRSPINYSSVGYRVVAKKPRAISPTLQSIAYASQIAADPNCVEKEELIKQLGTLVQTDEKLRNLTLHARVCMANIIAASVIPTKGEINLNSSLAKLLFKMMSHTHSLLPNDRVLVPHKQFSFFQAGFFAMQAHVYSAMGQDRQALSYATRSVDIASNLTWDVGACVSASCSLPWAVKILKGEKTWRGEVKQMITKNGAIFPLDHLIGIEATTIEEMITSPTDEVIFSDVEGDPDPDILSPSTLLSPSSAMIEKRERDLKEREQALAAQIAAFEQEKKTLRSKMEHTPPHYDMNHPQPPQPVAYSVDLSPSISPNLSPKLSPNPYHSPHSLPPNMVPFSPENSENSFSGSEQHTNISIASSYSSPKGLEDDLEVSPSFGYEDSQISDYIGDLSQSSYYFGEDDQPFKQTSYYTDDPSLPDGTVY